MVVVRRVVVVVVVAAGKFQIFVFEFDDGVGYDGPFFHNRVVFNAKGAGTERNIGFEGLKETT